MAAAEAALSSDPALGYTLVGSVTPGHAASLSDDDLLGLLAGRGADFVVITAGSDETEFEHAALDSLRRLGIPIALVPGLRGLPVTGFRQHYFLGHDIVMLVGSNNLTQPFSRLLKAAFDQIGAIILLVSVRAAAAGAGNADSRRRRTRILSPPPHRRRRARIRLHQVPLDGGRCRRHAAPAAGRRSCRRGRMGRDPEIAR